MPATSLTSVRPERDPRRSASQLDPALPLILAWSLISLGTARHYGVYTPLAIVLVSAGMAILTGAVLLLSRTEHRSPSRFGLLIGGVVAVVCNLFSPAERYARGSAATWSHALLVLAALVLLAIALAPAGNRATRGLGPAVLSLATLAGVAGIRATPAPTIDDFHILQGSARALLHGHNSYGHAWPGAEGHLLPYLPGSAILLAPFYLLLSDVRYGLLAALLAAALLIGRLDPARRATGLPVLAGLIMLFPWALYLIEQSWPEPLLLALLVGMVFAVGRGRPVLAVLCFAAALATKQTAFILVPFAAVWPAFGWRRTVSSVIAAGAVIGTWFALDPHQFVEGAIRYNLSLPPRRDSLSLFTTAIRFGHTPSFVLVPLLLALALALGLWKLPRTSAGFALGSAWLMGIFNLLNKQSFFNEWALVIGLIVLGVGCLTVAGEQPTASANDRPAPG